MGSILEKNEKKSKYFTLVCQRLSAVNGFSDLDSRDLLMDCQMDILNLVEENANLAENGDYYGLKLGLHKLKGTAGNLQMREIFDLVKKIESEIDLIDDLTLKKELESIKAHVSLLYGGE